MRWEFVIFTRRQMIGGDGTSSPIRQHPCPLVSSRLHHVVIKMSTLHCVTSDYLEFTWIAGTLNVGCMYFLASRQQNLLALMFLLACLFFEMHQQKIFRVNNKKIKRLRLKTNSRQHQKNKRVYDQKRILCPCGPATAARPHKKTNKCTTHRLGHWDTKYILCAHECLFFWCGRAASTAAAVKFCAFGGL